MEYVSMKDGAEDERSQEGKIRKKKVVAAGE